MFAKVVVNVASSKVDQEYIYALDEEDEKIAKIGSRVKVPFGNANRLVMGYILGFTNKLELEGDLKYVDEVVDYEPIINEEQLCLAQLIRDDAICPLIRILNQMIPNALVLKTKKTLTINNYNLVDAEIAVLFEKNNTITYNRTLKKYNSKIAKEISLGNISINYQAKQEIKERTVDKYIINPVFTYQNIDYLTSFKQKEFLKMIENEIALTSLELIEKYDISQGQIVSLYKKGFLSKIKEPISRIKVRQIPIEKKIRKTKDEDLINLIDKLEIATKPILYIPKDDTEQIDAIFQIINKNQKESKNVLIITPEILSNYELCNLIRQKTSLSVAEINSNLSDGELLDYFYEIKNGNYPVIVSTMVGALLPYQNIGDIILLNAESDNYYSDQSPRYNLKKVMHDYAKLLNANLVLSTLVPTVYDYTYGIKDHYHIVSSKAKETPINIEVVDLKQELKYGNNTPLSKKLEVELVKNYRNKKISLLIVNNKSYSSNVTCRTCGKTIVCNRCGISLQYNKKNNQLICPACSSRFPFENKCPTCNSDELKMGGFGIEQVEEVLKNKRPELNVSILKESTFNDYYNLMSEIENHEVDVIITTSLLAKSIETKYIGLVAIINLDSISKMPIYNANEKAYATLVHAKNCLGDFDQSTLLIQTYSLEEKYLKDFLTDNYHGFLKNELAVRKILKNEPFYYINRIVIKAKYEKMFIIGNEIKKYLQNVLHENVYVIGPSYNYKDQAAQLIIKHKVNNIGITYKKIYETYQSTADQSIIIIDRYPKYI